MSGTLRTIAAGTNIAVDSTNLQPGSTPAQDAMRLMTAMKGAATDEATVNKLIVEPSPQSLALTMNAWDRLPKTKTGGHSLRDWVKADTSFGRESKYMKYLDA